MADVKPATDEALEIMQASLDGFNDHSWNSGQMRSVKARLDAENARADRAEEKVKEAEADFDALNEKWTKEYLAREEAEKLARIATRSAEIEKGLRGEMQAAMDAATKRVAELEAARAWQPIATAPKDGTQILFGKVGGAVLKGRWERGSWIIHLNGCISKVEPTHWQSLPSPPTS